MPDLSVWPTDGADGSVSSEVRWRKMAKLFAASGSYQGLFPTLIAGPAITVSAGNAWLDGHYAELTATATVPVTANGLLVLRFTPADNRCELLYRDGATSPTWTDPTWELPIAKMTAGVMADARLLLGAGGRVPVVGALPLYPFEGMEVFLYSGYHQLGSHLVYYTGTPAPYQWLCVGGGYYNANVNTSAVLAAGGGYGDIAGNLGPGLILTAAGIYRVRMMATMTAQAAAAQGGIGANLLPGPGAANFGGVHNMAAANHVATAVVEQDWTVTAANLAFGPGYAQLQMRYYTAIGSVAFSVRSMVAQLVRAG